MTYIYDEREECALTANYRLSGDKQRLTRELELCQTSAAEKDARIAKFTESLKYAHKQLSAAWEENASLLTTLYTERSKVDMLHSEIRRQRIAHSDALATLNSKLEDDNG